MWGWWQRKRRKQWLEAGLSNDQRETLRQSVWQYERLKRPEQQQLAAWTRVFVEEKYWEGCGGQKITPEIKLTVAGQAGLMALGWPTWYFDATPTILIYPDAYMAPNQERPLPGGLTIVRDEAREGEAHYRGPVVLNRAEIESGGLGNIDARNLVIHEFAHQIDLANGREADGIPPLTSAIHPDEWRKEFQWARQRLSRDVERNLSTVIDPYGLHSPAEFFAVSCEIFFQDSPTLQHFEPRLHELLVRFFRVDPLAWGEPPG
jgi:Mlc titration factor MtfA (ptsG expression regulator)